VGIRRECREENALLSKFSYGFFQLFQINQQVRVGSIFRCEYRVCDAAAENSCPAIDSFFLNVLTSSATCLTVAVVISGAVSAKGMH
jgi:hypothetical protein